MSAIPCHGDAPRYLNIAGAMEQIGDEGALREMLPMVLESLTNDVPAITELLAKGDIKGANHLLHPLKGFIPIFCTTELYGRVSEVELMSKKGDVAAVSAAYAELAPELLRLKAEVAQYLGLAA